MILLEKHVICKSATIREALQQLSDVNGPHVTLFVIDEDQKVLGSVTDGDIRRAIISKGLDLSSKVDQTMNPNFKHIIKGEYDFEFFQKLQKSDVYMLPVLDEKGRISRIIDFLSKKTILPIDAVIIAGGRGQRLMPLTEKTPKPLLKVGDKPIIEYNVDRLMTYGVENIHITVNYLGEQLEQHFGAKQYESSRVSIVWENQPLGTIGSVSLVEGFDHDTVLVMNSDLLTNIDYEDFYRDFMEKSADLAVASIPYKVDIPYAVMETADHKVLSLKEKPTYTYYSNAGIYLIKKKLIEKIPTNKFYNATDLLELAIEQKLNVVTYPIHAYWLDIGKHEDFKKAQEDVKHIRF